jgi:hypothetical protein
MTNVRVRRCLRLEREHQPANVAKPTISYRTRTLDLIRTFKGQI